MKNKFAIFLLLLFYSITYADNEVFIYRIPGQSYCLVIDDDSNQCRWNTSTLTFASNVAKASQGTNFTEASGSLDGQFYVTFPATIPAGDYSLIYYNTTATAFDPNFTSVGGDRFFWSGSAEITDYTILEAIADVNCGGTSDPNIIILLNDIKAQVSDPNDKATIAGRIADIWLTNSGGFSN